MNKLDKLWENYETKDAWIMTIVAMRYRSERPDNRKLIPINRNSLRKTFPRPLRLRNSCFLQRTRNKQGRRLERSSVAAWTPARKGS